MDEVEEVSSKFRVHFLEMGKHILEEDLEAARVQGYAALEIARNADGWEQLEVGICIALADALLVESTYNNEALKLLNEATEISKKACALENPIGSVILIQALIAQASAYIYLENFSGAVDLLESALELAKEDEYCIYYQMEAERLLAICFEHEEDFLKAWNFNENALTSAQNIDHQIRMHSALPLVGEAMLNLAPTVNKEHEVERIHEKLIELVGENWHDKI
jgi:tetratricopeptide (TPR) repeat protein